MQPASATHGILTTATLLLSAATAPAASAQSDRAHSLHTPTGPPPAGGYERYSGEEKTRSMKIIGGVPGYRWFRGCGPTAAGMVIGYWDARGCSDLIPGSAATQTSAVNAAIAMLIAVL